MGRALTSHLRAAGFAVTAVGSSEADLRSADEARKLFEYAMPDLVVHLAARVHGLMGNMNSQGEAYLENILMNTNVVEASRRAGVKKFLGMGSTAIYSDLVGLPMRESDLWIGAPHGSEWGYAHAKRAMVAQLEAYREQYGMDYAFAVSTNLYGPGDRFDEAYGHVLPSLVSKFHRAKMDGADVEVWGTGTPTRDFVYSADAARALALILTSFSGVINLATGTSVTIRQAVETLAEVADFGGRVRWDATKPDGQHARAYDVSLLRALGWAPEFSLARGLESTYRWYSDHYESARR